MVIGDGEGSSREHVATVSEFNLKISTHVCSFVTCSYQIMKQETMLLQVTSETKKNTKPFDQKSPSCRPDNAFFRSSNEYTPYLIYVTYLAYITIYCAIKVIINSFLCFIL